jgi:hypothetical protein
VPFAVVAVVAAIRWVPETRSGTSARFDVGGALLAAAGLGGTSYALIQHAWWAAAVGVVALAAFVAWELRLGEAAMLPPRLFASAQFTALNVVTFLVYAGLSGIGFFLIVELQTVAGYSPLVAGTPLLPFTVLMLIGSGRAGALAARIGPRWLLVGGALMSAASAALMARVGPGARYLTDVLPPAIIGGLGITMLVAPLTTAVLGAAPNEMSGVASGVSNAVARAAGLLAIATLPLLVGLSGQEYAQPQPFDAAYHQAIWWCVGCYVAGALVAAVFVGPGQRVRDPGPGEPRARVSGASANMTVRRG